MVFLNVLFEVIRWVFNLLRILFGSTRRFVFFVLRLFLRYLLLNLFVLVYLQSLSILIWLNVWISLCFGILKIRIFTRMHILTFFIFHFWLMSLFIFFKCILLHIGYLYQSTFLKSINNVLCKHIESFCVFTIFHFCPWLFIVKFLGMLIRCFLFILSYFLTHMFDFIFRRSYELLDDRLFEFGLIFILFNLVHDWTQSIVVYVFVEVIILSVLQVVYLLNFVHFSDRLSDT